MDEARLQTARRRAKEGRQGMQSLGSATHMYKYVVSVLCFFIV